MDPDGCYAIYENSSLEKYFRDYIRNVQNKVVEVSETGRVSMLHDVKEIYKEEIKNGDLMPNPDYP